MEQDNKQDALLALKNYVKEHYEEAIEHTFSVVNFFENSSDQSDKQWGYECGFIMGMGWIGDIIGIDLNPISDEEKAEIDKIFNEANQ